jgi:hypothetical protein
VHEKHFSYTFLILAIQTNLALCIDLKAVNGSNLSYILSYFQTCSHILLPEDQRRGFMETLKRPNMGYLQKKSLTKKIGEKCKKVKNCPFCGAVNG